MAIDLWRPRGLARRGTEPFRGFDDLVSRMFDDWMSPRGAGEARGWSPAVDMIDKKDEIVLRADLPGLEQKDIHVSVDNGMLTIRGNRQQEHEAKEEDYYCCERWAGSFTRTMTLPSGIDPDKVKATFKNGVLEVHVPKSPKAMAKSIDIQAA
ncbi:MAG TPA: Hsp20/alpha crystallin family protein [Methylomirabilota bacterium]|jgi:HSP20 family protein|nr:Hsp20/alpha crystallin family protein [Methylomirabilota bacterium]